MFATLPTGCQVSASLGLAAFCFGPEVQPKAQLPPPHTDTRCQPGVNNAVEAIIDSRDEL